MSQHWGHFAATSPDLAAPQIFRKEETQGLVMTKLMKKKGYFLPVSLLFLILLSILVVGLLLSPAPFQFSLNALAKK
jgi:hypothetical protein